MHGAERSEETGTLPVPIWLVGHAGSPAHLSAAAHPLHDRPSPLRLEQEQLKIGLDLLQGCCRVRMTTRRTYARRLVRDTQTTCVREFGTKPAVRTASHFVPSANCALQVPLNTK